MTSHHSFGQTYGICFEKKNYTDSSSRFWISMKLLLMMVSTVISARITLISTDIHRGGWKAPSTIYIHTHTMLLVGSCYTYIFPLFFLFLEWVFSAVGVWNEIDFQILSTFLVIGISLSHEQRCNKVVKQHFWGSHFEGVLESEHN